MVERVENTAEAMEAAALPRMHEVHADPDRPAGPGRVPEKLLTAIGEKSPARWAYERLILYIRNFEEQLDAEHEVAMGFAGGDAGVLRIEGLGYFDPDILTFYGSDMSGARTQLIQHVSQLSVMLRAVPKPREDSPPQRIGFRLAAEIEDDAPDERG
ncbi:DUF6173 family protein [Jhaorihella thermophila]|uniref:Uncharacterized protein n=1 Tax=Jhaorihella thermophila TaxID=488547 RepID=A0A1H5SA70_9RHOB|nr:DUF6173 family protein [Jhaorihella thermophila]SEF46888.1 hypothetical protein SAMN05421751_101395 [Jhaorihella thermophila]